MFYCTDTHSVPHPVPPCVHAGISCASNRVGKTHCTAFNGLRWEAFAPGFLRWIDPTDRILVFTRVIWSHTKGLLTGMTLSSHQALTPATKNETIEVHATTQLFDLAFNQRVFAVQHEFPLMSPAEQLDRILGRQLDNGDFTAPNLTIAKKCYSWAVFPTARGCKIVASKSLSAKNMSQLVINGFHECVRYPPGVATAYSLRGGLIDISRKHNRAGQAKDGADHSVVSTVGESHYATDQRNDDTSSNHRGSSTKDLREFVRMDSPVVRRWY